jgi:small subunit ribosomal protein S6
LAEKRVYEVVFILDPGTPEEEATRLVENFQNIITEQGGSVVRSEGMGRRPLAYHIGHKKEGIYWLFELEGSGSEIAELERRMRVSDAVIRYMTVRVDEDRQRAEKFKERRTRKAGKRQAAAGAGGGRGASAGAGAAAAPALVPSAEEEEAGA